MEPLRQKYELWYIYTELQLKTELKMVAESQSVFVLMKRKKTEF